MISLAPLEEALTFARTVQGRTIAVRHVGENRITGIDVTALIARGDDAIGLVNRLGHEGTCAEITKSAEQADVDVRELGIPVNLSGAHVAVGTNYREHAREASVTGDPFIFPKIVTPTSWQDRIPAGDALLDYEVELCLVPMKPIAPGEPASGGLIIGNDVTDRAVLLRNVDPADPQSGKGFTSGKSAPGYLPVGNFFVVPRDLRSFVAGLTLQLSVNGTERQRAPVTEWIWDLDEILRQAWQRKDVSWAWTEGVARLPFTPAGAVPPRTLIMAGTPAGTVWQGPARSDMALGAMDFLLGGFRRPVIKCVIERYISRARKAHAYLQPGDRVTIRMDRLGMMDNRIG